MSSFFKNTPATAKLRYIEHSTPVSEKYLKALTFLGIDIGNKTQKEYTILHTIFKMNLLS